MTAKLLVVDDETEICELLKGALEEEGYSVETAHSGNSALRLVRKTPFNLVITDINMADGNGVELLDNIKAIDPIKPAVLFMSAYADVEVETIFDRGAEGYLTKPFTIDTVIEVVKNALTEKEELWRRKFERLKTPLISVEFSEKGDSKTTSGILSNVGRGGIFITLKERIPHVGMTISFKITSAGDPPILVEGVGIVRWCRPAERDGSSPGIGVEFLSLTPHSINQTLALINALKLKTFIPKG